MSTETVSPAPQATTTSSAGSDGPTFTAAFAGVRRVPAPVNDPNRTYAPGSPERAELKARLKSMADEKIDIPIIMGVTFVSACAIVVGNLVADLIAPLIDPRIKVQ